MRILVEEEYGYRHWEWIPHTSAKCELLEFWNQIDGSQFQHIFHDVTLLGGMWRELIEPEEEEQAVWFYREVINRNNYDGYAHIHEIHDSYLCMRDDQNEFVCHSPRKK